MSAIEARRLELIEENSIRKSSEPEWHRMAMNPGSVGCIIERRQWDGPGEYRNLFEWDPLMSHTEPSIDHFGAIVWLPQGVS